MTRHEKGTAAGELPFVRPANAGDIDQMRRLLNEIIEVGGTTALEEPLSETDFRDYFLEGETLLACHVALDDEGKVAGFQSLGRHPKLAEDWADIATFARLAPKVRGVGTALFKKTCTFAREHQIKSINATIRADNTGGLTYYGKIGFETYKTDKSVPLSTGQKVDRVSKVFHLNAE